MTLIEYLPPDEYDNEIHVRDYQDAIGKQISLLWQDMDSLIAQGRPSTAIWGMVNYEREYGLPVDLRKPKDQRLAAYRAKRRGFGVITVDVLKNIAASFYNGEISIIEHKREFWFEITFLSNVGIPPNLDDLKAAIEDVKPAHMEAVYNIIWTTHAQLSRFTHAQLSQYTHEQIRTLGGD